MRDYRAFLAFEIPADLREVLDRELRNVRGELPQASWVRPESLHLTLKFLGESDPKLLEALTEDLGERLTGLPAVRLHLRGTGFFPSRGRPRVAWIGGLAQGVTPVVSAVEEVSQRYGWKAEARPWSLHLTLARLKTPWPSSAVSRFTDWGEGIRLEPFRADRVVLFSSTMKPGGAVYTPLQILPLAGGGTM